MERLVRTPGERFTKMFSKNSPGLDFSEKFLELCMYTTTRIPQVMPLETV